MSYVVELETMSERPAAVVAGTVSEGKVGSFIGKAFTSVMQALSEQHQFPVGEPFACYHVNGNTFEIHAGFPVTSPVTASGNVEPFMLPGGNVATTLHVGPYDKVADAYNAIMAWLPTQNLQPAGDPWEVYLDEPGVDEPRTRVFVPCRPSSDSG